MAEGDDGDRQYFGMLRALGKLANNVVETLLAGLSVLVLDGDVPVLRALLDEGHGHA